MWRARLAARLAPRAWGRSLDEDLTGLQRLAPFVALVPALDRLALDGARSVAAALDTEAGIERIAVERGALPVLIAGDSHSSLWVRQSQRGGRRLLPLQRMHTGASARGLGRADAASGAGAEVAALLARLDGRWPTVLKFGQVDLEFVHAYRRLESGTPAYDAAAFDAFAHETVALYAAWLDSAVPVGARGRTHIAGVFPPALSDASWRAGYVNADIAGRHGLGLSDRVAELEVVPLQERTRGHAAFNAALKPAVEALGLRFLDDLTPLLGVAGTVAERYLGAGNGADHHLSFLETQSVMVRRLWSVAT